MPVEAGGCRLRTPPLPSFGNTASTGGRPDSDLSLLPEADRIDPDVTLATTSHSGATGARIAHGDLKSPTLLAPDLSADGADVGPQRNLQPMILARTKDRPAKRVDTRDMGAMGSVARFPTGYYSEPWHYWEKRPESFGTSLEGSDGYS